MTEAQAAARNLRMTSRTLLIFLALFVVAVPLLFPVAVMAQGVDDGGLPSGDSGTSDLEAEDDANRTANRPEDCVRPDVNGPDQDADELTAFPERQKAYEDCLERTGGEKPDSEGGGGGGGTPDQEQMNEDATQPEECAPPEAAEENDPQKYADQQEAYDECIERTGKQQDDNQGDNPECEALPDDPTPGELREYEDCLREAGQLDNDDAAPGEQGEANDAVGPDPGGLAGIGLNVFKKILSWLYGAAVVAPAEQAADFMAEEAFELPDLEGGGLLSVYEKLANVLKPGVIPIMAYLGILMMFKGTDYNATTTVQNSLPKIFLFLAGVTFFPDFLKIFGDIANGLADVFVTREGLEQFLSGVMKSETGEESGSLDLAIISYIVLLFMLLLVGFMAMLKNIAFAVLVVAGPLPMFLWLIPGLSSAAGVWARGLIACLLMPILFAAEIGIGIALSQVPAAIFGSDQGSDLHSMFIAIAILYLMWQTPKQLIIWALGGGGGGGGGFISHAVRSLVIGKTVGSMNSGGPPGSRQ